MSTYHVDVHLFIHRCPANPEPHVVQTQRTVVKVVKSRECQAPFLVRGRLIACARVAVFDKQCRACKTHVIIRNTQTTDLGFQGPAQLSLDEHLTEVAR